MIIRRVLEARQHAQLHPTDTFSSTPRNFSSPTVPNLGSIMNATSQNPIPFQTSIPLTATNSQNSPNKGRDTLKGAMANTTAALDPPTAEEEKILNQRQRLNSVGWPVEVKSLGDRIKGWARKLKCW